MLACRAGFKGLSTHRCSRQLRGDLVDPSGDPARRPLLAPKGLAKGLGVASIVELFQPHANNLIFRRSDAAERAEGVEELDGFGVLSGSLLCDAEEGRLVSGEALLNVSANDLERLGGLEVLESLSDDGRQSLFETFEVALGSTTERTSQQ